MTISVKRKQTKHRKSKKLVKKRKTQKKLHRRKMRGGDSLSTPKLTRKRSRPPDSSTPLDSVGRERAQQNEEIKTRSRGQNDTDLITDGRIQAKESAARKRRKKSERVKQLTKERKKTLFP